MTEPPASGLLTGLWKELRQRKVVQWTLGYAAAAWALLQVTEFAVATFQWPVAITRVAAVVAAASVPVAVTLAWFHGDRGEQRLSRPEILILAVLLIAGGLLVRHELHSQVASETAIVRTAAPLHEDRYRIAILPFDNLGGDPANVAFVGGVHDTLITLVAKVPGLSVISRSSVLQFADKRPAIRDIAATLGVGSVLEGSVQREGSRLRIQAQLIDANTDQHLWAETYDRQAEDLFAVQSEIAQAVAEQLRIRLTSNDAQRLKASLTSKPEAYDHYVLGRDFSGRLEYIDALRELTAAVTIDPEFAAAHAQLGLARSWLCWVDPTTASENLPLARAAIDRALALDPTLPEAHLAQAIYFYRGVEDIDRAAAEFERAIAGLPNDALAFQSFGFLRRWQQRWEDAAALFARAAALDPGGEAVKFYADSLVALGRDAEAAKAIRAGQAAQPDDAELAMSTANLAVNVACDLRTMETALAKASVRFPNEPAFLIDQAYFALATGDSAKAAAAVDRLASQAEEPDQVVPALVGLAYPPVGRSAESDRRLRARVEFGLRTASHRSPGETRADDLAFVASYYALLGDRRHAAEYARRAVDDLPASGEGSNREEVLYWSAIALVRAGDRAAAVARMRDKFAVPGSLRAGATWCDPFLAELRSEPSYRELMAGQGADVRIDPLDRATWPPVWTPK